MSHIITIRGTVMHKFKRLNTHTKPSKATQSQDKTSQAKPNQDNSNQSQPHICKSLCVFKYYLTYFIKVWLNREKD